MRHLLLPVPTNAMEANAAQLSIIISIAHGVNPAQHRHGMGTEGSMATGPAMLTVHGGLGLAQNDGLVLTFIMGPNLRMSVSPPLPCPSIPY